MGKDLSEEVENSEAIAQARVKTGDFISKLMMTYAGFATFCAFTLFSPDRLILLPQASLNMPFAGNVSFPAFILVAPIVLVGMRIYLEVYLIRWRELDDRIPPEAEPLTVSPIKHPVLKWFSAAVIHGLLPIMLALFTWKAAAREELGHTLAVLLVMTLCVQFEYVRAANGRRRPVLHGLQPITGISAFSVVSGFEVAAYALAIFVIFGGPPLRPLELARADLRDAYLPSAVLRYADLRDANLTRARLSRVDLQGADLRGANLHGADFSEAILSDALLVKATLVEVNFKHAALLRAKLFRSKISKADFTDADLTRADFSYSAHTGTKFERAFLISADLGQAAFEDTSFRGAKMENATLFKSTFEKVRFRGATLRNANLRGVTLVQADLRSADFRDVDLIGARMPGANLRETNLSNADLSHADLRKADLSKAKLVGARLHIANFEKTILKNTNVSATYFHNVKNLSPNALVDACFRPRTKKNNDPFKYWPPGGLPTGVLPPKNFCIVVGPSNYEEPTTERPR